MMDVQLPYGRTGLTVSLPDNTTIIRSEFVPGFSDEPAALRAAVRSPIGSLPLAQKVKAGDRVVIVHSDITRATPNDRIMPVLLAELEAAGIARQDITLLNALGTHRPQTDAELRQMLGDFVVDHYRCLQHDGHDDANLVSLGTTSFGHPVRINRHYMEAEVKILTGFIEPHFFAGFSGGPKGVLPSVAGAESVQTNHGSDMISHPKASWGILEGNPIWEEMREAALRTNPTFLLNVTLNARREITGVFAGDLLAAHKEGCQFVRKHAMVRLSEPFDIAVTTNGGYPLDQNLYQTIKGVSAAARATRDGSAIVLAARCEDGLPDHGGYMRLFDRARSPQHMLEIVADPACTEQDRWTAQIQAQIELTREVHVYSEGLSDDQIRRTFYTPTRDPGATVRELLKRYGPNARVCVMPEGPQTVCTVG
jgi:nickel-dependent lactate racemase